MSQNASQRPLLPATFARGQQLRAVDLENVRQAVAFALGDMIGAGPGILVSRRGDRYLISSERRRASGDKLRALVVSRASATAVAVSAGAIRNTVPTIGGDLITDNPPPLLTIAASGVIYLDATVDEDTGAVTALSIATAATVPADDADTGKAYKGLASVVFSGGAITELTPLAWNLTEVQLCGGIYLWGGFGGD